MSKARFFSSALDGQTVTMSATRLGLTKGPKTRTNWGVGPSESDWEGVAPASLTVTVNEVLPAGDLFAPLPVEWRIRVTGTSYGTPDYDPFPGAEPYTALTQEQVDTMRLGWEAYDPSYQRCHFVVHTGDTGNYRNTWVASPAHRDKAYEYGQNCGHVYSEPGTYQRSIYVYDDEGNWGTLALDPLVVVDPDTVFDAVSTIVVDPASDWASAPAHDVANRFTTLDAAAAWFETRKKNVATTKGMRICIKAGASFTERCRTFTTKDAKGPCLVDTYGGADRFTYSERDLDVDVNVSLDRGEFLFSVGDDGWAWRIRDGDFDFGYGVVDGRPSNASGWTGADKVLNRGFLKIDATNLIYDAAKNTDPKARVLMHNLNIKGCGWFCTTTLMSEENSARGVALYINDCDFTNIADYVTLNPQNIFIMGTALKSVDGGNLGGMGRSRTMGTSRGWTGHPIMLREQLAWTVYIRACYMESRGSWAGIGETTFRGGQPMMRLNNRSESSADLEPGGWVSGRGKRYYICDSVIVGFFGLDTSGETLTAGANPQPIGGAHAVLENCLLVLDPQSGSPGMNQTVSGRASIRNCVYLTLNTPWNRLDTMTSRDLTRWETSDNRMGEFDWFFRADDNVFKYGSRLENRHNTFVMLRTDANLRFGTFVTRSATSHAPFVEANYEMVEGHNVLSAPNMAAPQGPSMSAIDLPVGMRVLDPWLKWSWERKAFTLASAVANGAETPAIEYPVDWYGDPTVGADYTGSAGNNSIDASDGNRYYQPGDNYPNSRNVQADRPDADKMTIIHDCDASGVVQGDGTGTHFKVLNRSGVEWPAGACIVILDRGSTAMVAETPATPGTALGAVTQSEFKLYRPTSPQALDPGLGSTLWDFNRNRRPNAGFAISPTSGTNAAGAILPA